MKSRREDHNPMIEKLDDAWTAYCGCGAYLGGFDTAEEAGDAYQDHMGALYEA
jgi:hypothetical protein